MIYLDNNATTFMTKDVQRSMLQWCNSGNPSSGYESAKSSRAMMEDFRALLRGILKIHDYDIIFTSGASEANGTVLAGVISLYKVPHVVMSAIEHKSLHSMAESYIERGLATFTFIEPTKSGHIHPSSVEKAIKPNTCLICVMHANNETGAINDVKAIGHIARKHGILFHCDTVQSFGKIPIMPSEYYIDSLCISFHKVHGPPGVGALIMRRQLKIPPIIFGTQNNGFRGGTENIPGIGASFTAVKSLHMKDNTDLKKMIMFQLSKYYPCVQYTKYTSSIPIQIVFLSGATEYYLNNTLLLSIVKNTKPYICNSKIKEYLEKKGIIISVGSACNTASKKASHVLYAMDVDKYIRKGALRISLGCNTTYNDVSIFIDAFLEAIKQQL